MSYTKDYFDQSSVKTGDKFKIYLGFLRKLLGLDFCQTSICDIGCATGEFFEVLGRNPNYLGLDISAYAIEECRKKFPQDYANFFQIDIDRELPSIKEKLDIITLFDTIEHLFNFTFLKTMIEKNLKGGGYLVVTTPNANSFLRFISPKNFTGEIDKTHTIIFTPYTLDFFLRRLKLKKVNLSTPYSFYFKNNFLTKKILFGGQIFAVYQK